MKKLLSVLLVLVMALSLAMPAMAEESIKIGVIGPMTGPAAIYGMAVARGAQIAADEINAKGGIQIELNVQDDEHDAEKAINAYNAVMDAEAQMIIALKEEKQICAIGYWPHEISRENADISE